MGHGDARSELRGQSSCCGAKAFVDQMAGIVSWPDCAADGAHPCSWYSHEQNASETAQRLILQVYLFIYRVAAGCLVCLSHGKQSMKPMSILNLGLLPVFRFHKMICYIFLGAIKL